MRFKVDENLPTEVAEALRAAGHDAPTVLDQGAGGMPDFDLAALVKREERALLTFDQGFGDIRSHPPGEYSGLVVLRLKRQDKTHLLSVLPRLIGTLPHRRSRAGSGSSKNHAYGFGVRTGSGNRPAT